MKRIELVLAGNGGQGLIMMGVLIGQAACADGHNVAQTQTYGIAMRGGISYSEVVISDEPITYPKVMAPDFILTLTGETFHIFHKKYPGALIAVDEGEFDIPATDGRTIKLPLSRYCREIGDMRILNIMAIGAVEGATEMLGDEMLERTIAARFPKSRESNLAAYRVGVEMGRSLIKGV